MMQSLFFVTFGEGGGGGLNAKVSIIFSLPK